MVDKKPNFLMSKKFTLIISFLGLYLFSAGISWAFFSYVGEGSGILSGESKKSKINLDLPKTEECPLNGDYFTVTEREIWETRRPIAAIVENHADSRPPSGIGRADVVYEAVAEGGITRFLNIFYCGAAAGDLNIAPVRSARVHFIDYASEYGDRPIFMHVGGANDYAGFGDTVKEARALELLETIGWRVPRGNDFDTTYDSGFPVFWRNYERLDHDVATEHTMMASIDEAYKQAEKRGFEFEDSKGNAWNEDFISWNFSDGTPNPSATAKEISFTFWENSQFSDEYAVKWIYDMNNNLYLRENGGKKHYDLETGEQLSAANVIILFARERVGVDRNHHVLYTTVGKGDSLVFQNGDVIESTWEKDTRTDRTKIYGEDGSEISFVRGKIWIELLPIGVDVDY